MRPALEVADIFRRHGTAYRANHADSLSLGQRRIMAAIEACRTAALGGHIERCEDCGETRIAYNSCRNRHCPKCQGLARAQWLADRQAQTCITPPVPTAGFQAAIEERWQHEHAEVSAIFRDTTLQAFEGCLYGPASGWCGLHGPNFGARRSARGSKE